MTSLFQLLALCLSYKLNILSLLRCPHCCYICAPFWMTFPYTMNTLPLIMTLDLCHCTCIPHVFQHSNLRRSRNSPFPITCLRGSLPPDLRDITWIEEKV